MTPFFDAVPPEHRAEVEALYQAFKQRLLLELQVVARVQLTDDLVLGELTDKSQGG